MARDYGRSKKDDRGIAEPFDWSKPSRSSITNRPAFIHRPPHQPLRTPLPRLQFSLLVYLGDSPCRVLLVSRLSFQDLATATRNFFPKPLVTRLFLQKFWLLWSKCFFVGVKFVVRPENWGLGSWCFSVRGDRVVRRARMFKRVDIFLRAEFKELAFANRTIETRRRKQRFVPFVAMGYFRIRHSE